MNTRRVHTSVLDFELLDLVVQTCERVGVLLLYEAYALLEVAQLDAGVGLVALLVELEVVGGAEQRAVGGGRCLAMHSAVHDVLAEAVVGLVGLLVAAIVERIRRRRWRRRRRLGQASIRRHVAIGFAVAVAVVVVAVAVVVEVSIGFVVASARTTTV